MRLKLIVLTACIVFVNSVESLKSEDWCLNKKWSDPVSGQELWICVDYADNDGVVDDFQELLNAAREAGFQEGYLAGLDDCPIIEPCPTFQPPTTKQVTTLRLKVLVRLRNLVIFEVFE